MKIFFVLIAFVLAGCSNPQNLSEIETVFQELEEFSFFEGFGGFQEELFMPVRQTSQNNAFVGTWEAFGMIDLHLVFGDDGSGAWTWIVPHYDHHHRVVDYFIWEKLPGYVRIQFLDEEAPNVWRILSYDASSFFIEDIFGFFEISATRV